MTDIANSLEIFVQGVVEEMLDNDSDFRETNDRIDDQEHEIEELTGKIKDLSNDMVKLEKNVEYLMDAVTRLVKANNQLLIDLTECLNANIFSSVKNKILTWWRTLCTKSSNTD